MGANHLRTILVFVYPTEWLGDKCLQSLNVPNLSKLGLPIVLRTRFRIAESSGSAFVLRMTWGNSPDTRTESVSVNAQIPLWWSFCHEDRFESKRECLFSGGITRIDRHTKSYAIGSVASLFHGSNLVKWTNPTGITQVVFSTTPNLSTKEILYHEKKKCFLSTLEIPNQQARWW